jgi:hypothetical protein
MLAKFKLETLEKDLLAQTYAKISIGSKPIANSVQIIDPELVP